MQCYSVVLMCRSLRRLAVRQLRTHPWQLMLAILGIALGVAVAVSIDLANGSALRAFGLATDAVGGRATHQILGGPSGLDRKSTRLNSSHSSISYAVFCLKKKNTQRHRRDD